MDTIKQSMAALVGSFVLAGCLGNPDVAGLPTADPTEQSSENKAGDSTTSWHPAFRLGSDAPVGTDVWPEWGAASLLAGVFPAPEAGRPRSVEAPAFPTPGRLPGDGLPPPDRRRT